MKTFSATFWSKKGISLLEVLVATGLVATLAALTANVLPTFVRRYEQMRLSQTYENLRLEARFRINCPANASVKTCAAGDEISVTDKNGEIILEKHAANAGLVVKTICGENAGDIRFLVRKSGATGGSYSDLFTTPYGCWGN